MTDKQEQRYETIKQQFKPFTTDNIDDVLLCVEIDCILTLKDRDKNSVERTKAKDTGKGYPTTGYKLPYIWHELIKVFGAKNLKIETDIIQVSPISWGTEVIAKSTVSILNGAEVLIDTWGFGGAAAKLQGDAYKGAVTNSVKKALSFIGIGIGAYKGTVDEDNAKAPTEYIDTLGKPVEDLHWMDFKKELAKALDEYSNLVGVDAYATFFEPFKDKDGNERLMDAKMLMKVKEKRVDGNNRKPWLLHIYKECVDGMKKYELSKQSTQNMPTSDELF